MKMSKTKVLLLALLALMVLCAGTALAEGAASSDTVFVSGTTADGEAFTVTMPTEGASLTKAGEPVSFTIVESADRAGKLGLASSDHNVVYVTTSGVGGSGCCQCQGGSARAARGVVAAMNADDVTAQQFLFKTENGEMTYSTDGGATWTEGTPAGASLTTDVDGDKVTTTITMNDASEEAVGPMLDYEDGELQYSLDGGATWTSDLPEGYVVETVGGSLVLRAE